jgi:hypothetical protein
MDDLAIERFVSRNSLILGETEGCSTEELSKGRSIAS